MDAKLKKIGVANLDSLNNKAKTNYSETIQSDIFN
jgi:hypothetical protein